MKDEEQVKCWNFLFSLIPADANKTLYSELASSIHQNIEKKQDRTNLFKCCFSPDLLDKKSSRLRI